MGTENLDISSFIDPDGPSSPESGPRDTGADVLVRCLMSWSERCKDVPVDLRTAEFSADDNGMRLTLPEGSATRKLDFKRDPANPTDPRIILPQKQFCSMLGVPRGFFMISRPAMRERMVKTWQSSLETDDRRARCIARVREGDSVTVIRALVPERAVPPRACDIVRMVVETFHDLVCVDFVHGDEKDDPVLHARFVFPKDALSESIDLRMGFDLVLSELGACPMTIDALLHDPQAGISFVASYGGEPFFSSKYEGLQAKDVQAMLPGLLARIRLEAPEMAAAITTAIADSVYSVKQDCMTITRAKGVTTAMRRAVFHEAAEHAISIVSRMDFARHVSSVAKDFDSMKRLVLERAAGRYLNLCFARSPEIPVEGNGNAERDGKDDGAAAVEG